MVQSFIFASRQELATARAACRRLLATRSRLTPSQQKVLTTTLTALEAVSDIGPAETSLTSSQQTALVTALRRLANRTIAASAPNIAHLMLARLPQVTPWPLINADVVQFVRLGYGSSHGLAVSSLSFAVAMPDLPTLETCLTESIGSYNHFNGPAVAAAFAPLWDDLSTVFVGRESSPFVQIHVPYTRQQRNGGDNTCAIALEPAEREALINSVIDMGTACHADSILFNTATKPTLSPIQPPVRDLATVWLWWD